MQGEFTKEIDGVYFTVYQLGFAESRKLLVKVLKAIAPPLASLLDGTPSLAALGSAIPANALDKAVEMLCTAVSDEDLEEITETLSKGAFYSPDGSKRIRLDKAGREAAFSGGRLMRYFSFLKFGMEANYADFLGELKERVGVGDPGTKTPQSLQSASTKSE